MPWVEIGVRVALVVVALVFLPDIFTADTRLFWRRMRALSLDHVPYRDFLWEFPPLTIVPALLAVPLKGSADAFALAFGVVMAAVEVAALTLMCRACPREARRVHAYWLAVALPLSTFAYFRFDWVSVLAATVALVAIERTATRPKCVPAAMTAGFATKLWPVILAVPLLLRGRRRDVERAMAGCIIVIAGWWAFSPSGLDDFLVFRRGYGFQVESTVGSFAHLFGAPSRFALGSLIVEVPGSVALDLLQTMLVGVIGVAVVFAATRRPTDDVLLTGGLLVLVLLGSRLLSPQFLVWAVPFVSVGWARGARLAGWCFGAASAVSLGYMYAYDRVVAGELLPKLAIVARNLLLVVVAVSLMRHAFASGRLIAPPTAPTVGDAESRIA